MDEFYFMYNFEDAWKVVCYAVVENFHIQQITY